MKKLLIIYGSYGSGHKSIGENIKKYFEEHGKDYEIKIIDITEYSNSIGKLSTGYLNFVAKHQMEHFWDTCYEIVDNKIFTFNQDQIAKLFFDNEELRKEIVDFQPDININSHFYGGNIVNYYNKKGLINAKIISVLTDYAPHYCWLVDRKDQDAFVVANDIMKKEMIRYGVDSKKVYSFGIPFDQDRIKDLDEKEIIVKRYNLDKNIPTYVMFSGGSIGMLAYYNYFKALVEKSLPVNILFICGKNEKLKEKSEQLINELKPLNVQVLGFTNDVYNILKIADIVITKPGGATVTECIHMNVPMILTPGMGGPEKYNMRFIKAQGFGDSVRSPYKLVSLIEIISQNPKIIETWKNNLQKQEKTDSLQKIFELTEKMINK